MSVVTPASLTVPPDLARDLENQAKGMGMSVIAYLRFLMRVETRKHDAAFVDAAKFVFSKYPNTLRTLAQ